MDWSRIAFLIGDSRVLRGLVYVHIYVSTLFSRGNLSSFSANIELSVEQKLVVLDVVGKKEEDRERYANQKRNDPIS